MIDFILESIALAGPFALGIMGWVVVDKPPQTLRSRWLWYAAFAAISVVSFGAGLISSQRQDARLTRMLTGGENFPYFFGGFDKKDLNDRAELILTADDHTPLFDVAFSIRKHPNLTPYVSRTVGTLLQGAHRTGIRIDAGTYQVDFYARNGTFVQMIYFEACEGEMRFVTTVTDPYDGGRALRQSPVRRCKDARH
jgi:hypothetical protein